MDPSILDALQRRFGTADFSRYQVIRGQKYDYVRLAPAGTNQVAFFTNPIGANDPVGGTAKTLEDTNSVKSASFGQEYFALTAIRCDARFLPVSRQPGGVATLGTNFVFQGYTSLAQNAMEEFNDLLNRGVLTVSFAQKLYQQLSQPWITAPAGFGLDIQSLGASKPAGSVNKDNYWIQPSTRGEDIFRVDPVQVIEPEIQVEVRIDFPGGINSPVFTNKAVISDGTTTFTPAIQLGVIFDGYVIRPSQ